MAGPQKVLAVFYGGNHNIFSGRRQKPELALEDKILKAATQSLSLAFIRQVGGQSKSALSQWQQQHQPLLARYEDMSVVVETASNSNLSH
jgi:hypothetical protein